MSLQDNIDSLVNMGFDASVARVALERANNNIEVAVNYIYADSSGELPSYSEQTESGALGPVQDGHSASTAIPIEDDIRDKIASYGYGAENQEIRLDSDESEHEALPKYDVYDDISRYIRAPEVPGVLLPVKIDLLEGYFAPLLMILSNIPVFRDTVLEHEFEDYGYSPYWWKKERCLSNPDVTMEVQRLVAFLSSDSKRAFASIRTLIDASAKLITDDYESISEFIQFIYSTIIELFGKLGWTSKERLMELFTSQFQFENDETQTHRIFPVESNYFYKDVYRIMHSLLWGKDLSRIAQHGFVRLSDVLTISFEGNGDTVPGGGFELTEEFYPQIYTSEYEKLVVDKFQRINELREEVSKINGQNMQLKAFKGKRVAALLESTLNHLSSLGEDEKIQSASKELEGIASHILDQKTLNTDKLTALNKERSQMDIYSIDYILGEHKPDLEPWILVGVILSERQFCYRTEKGWYTFVYELEEGKNFTVTESTFDTIRGQIRDYSADNFETGMVLLYVRKSLLTSSRPIINEKLKQFISTDNEKVTQDYEAFMSQQPNKKEDAYVLVDM
ncbi:hypothetical protein KL907_001819 [Ogataea polymorpha]|nr:hypothetical protein KL907_001819 [Ogataea polymorpha]KAG7921060.1 hypothetical protein KL927_000304 [Ogataea polymorpha]